MVHTIYQTIDVILKNYLTVLEDNLHFAQFILFEMLIHNMLTLTININALIGQSLRGGLHVKKKMDQIPK